MERDIRSSSSFSSLIFFPHRCIIRRIAAAYLYAFSRDETHRRFPFSLILRSFLFLFPSPPLLRAFFRSISILGG